MVRTAHRAWAQMRLEAFATSMANEPGERLCGLLPRNSKASKASELTKYIPSVLITTATTAQEIPIA